MPRVTSPYPGQNFGCFLLGRSVILRSADSEYPRLISHEIIYEESQPM